MIAAHSALSYSAKAHIRACHMHDNIVDASAAVGEAGSNIFNKPLVLSKDIKGIVSRKTAQPILVNRLRKPVTLKSKVTGS